MNIVQTTLSWRYQNASKEKLQAVQVRLSHLVCKNEIKVCTVILHNRFYSMHRN